MTFSPNFYRKLMNLEQNCFDF